jgi:hypothetical protein
VQWNETFGFKLVNTEADDIIDDTLTIELNEFNVIGSPTKVFVTSFIFLVLHYIVVSHFMAATPQRKASH